MKPGHDRLDRYLPVAADPRRLTLIFRTGRHLRRLLWWLCNHKLRGALAVRSAEAAAWLSPLLADREWARMAGQWSGDQFNTLCSAYSRAMDGSFSARLQAGAEHVPPWLHRLIDGRHSIIGSLEECRKALHDDSLIAELRGWSIAFLSDLSSPVGMPIVTLSESTFRTIENILGAVGISRDWAIDAASFNLEEFVATAVPGLAVILNWTRAEAEEFHRMLGALVPPAAVAANPILAVVLVVGAARAFTLHRKSGRAPWAAAFAKGNLTSGIVLASGWAIGGPIWIGMVAGLLLAIMADRCGAQIDAARLWSTLRSVVKTGWKAREQRTQAV